MNVFLFTYGGSLDHDQSNDKAGKQKKREASESSYIHYGTQKSYISIYLNALMGLF